MRQRSDSNRQSQMVLVGGGGQEHCKIKRFNFFVFGKNPSVYGNQDLSGRDTNKALCNTIVPRSMN